MNKDLFGPNANGMVVSTASGNPAFVPAPLPPEIDWSHSGLWNCITSTAEAVAKLSHAADDIASPFIVDAISSIFATREARLSSQIEGIHTNTVEVLLAQQEEEGASQEPPTPESTEVVNYLRALRAGLTRVKDPTDLPICNRLIRDLHRQLLSGVRGRDKNPGEFRKSQNFIGHEGDTEESALYVPPPPAQMLESMDQLEKVMRSDQFAHINIYAQVAFVHYQFEAIHPFMDGNGRVGRLLMVLMICASGKLPMPLIYPSVYYEANRQDYYEKLFAVSHSGDWIPWVEFILKGIETQATDGIARVGVLRTLHANYRDKYQDGRHSGKFLKLIDRLFKNPVVSASFIKKYLDVNGTTAKRYLDSLLEEEIITPVYPERRRNQVYMAFEILRSIEEESRQA
jgi:Fic family protein